MKVVHISLLLSMIATKETQFNIEHTAPLSPEEINYRKLVLDTEYMKKLFNSYLGYAIQPDTEGCSASKDCAPTYCCTKVVLDHSVSNTKEELELICIKSSVTEKNASLSLKDFTVNMGCLNTVGSGAASLMVGSAAASVVASYLF